MCEFEIIPIKNYIKLKDNLYKNTFLDKLTNIIIKNPKIEGLNKFIRDLFYLKNVDENDLALTKNLIGYEKGYQYFITVYNLFKEFKPYDRYDLGFLRGSFLELLSYKYIKLIYDEKNIFTESKIKINKYESHNWDIIVKINNSLKLYECKFSSKYIKREHLNKMYGTHNKLPQSNIYLTTFELKDIIMDNLNKLINNTSIEKFNEMIKTFNYIYLEDYYKKNPFLCI